MFNEVKYHNCSQSLHPHVQSCSPCLAWKKSVRWYSSCFYIQVYVIITLHIISCYSRFVYQSITTLSCIQYVVQDEVRRNDRCEIFRNELKLLLEVIHEDAGPLCCHTLSGSAVRWSYPASVWEEHSVNNNTSLLEAWMSFHGDVMTGHNPTFQLLWSQKAGCQWDPLSFYAKWVKQLWATWPWKVLWSYLWLKTVVIRHHIALL